jgi:hypothetical protein
MKINENRSQSSTATDVGRIYLREKRTQRINNQNHTKKKLSVVQLNENP